MIEDLPIDSLDRDEWRRLSLSLRRQLHRGVPEHRVEHMLSRLRELDLASVSVAFEAAARARARASRRVDHPSARAQRPHPETLPLEGLDVAGLLRLRRALKTTSPVAREKREQDIRARVLEIERLLGVSARDYGALRVAVQCVEDDVIDLGASDLGWDERARIAARCQRAWERGIAITSRIVAATTHPASRAHALDAYRRLTRASEARIRATRGAARGTLESTELERWVVLYSAHDLG